MQLTLLGIVLLLLHIAHIAVRVGVAVRSLGLQLTAQQQSTRSWIALGLRLRCACVALALHLRCTCVALALHLN